jgi:hypothetical protein
MMQNMVLIVEFCWAVDTGFSSCMRHFLVAPARPSGVLRSRPWCCSLSGNWI